MKTAVYKTQDGKDLKVEYDEKAPCIVCRLPVEEASMGGTAVCPSCDCGVYRDGTKMDVIELLDKKRLRKKAREIYDRICKLPDSRN